ncbi:endolytic peptidoglycan transglycosylase RlpA [Pectobacterium versatile]|uniref:Endolytic peptidoglycan transglycosylase RlpA n=1 Tax=Pectobacterium versatile TaxID=2488639 RepID=A0A855MML1_9GAMM|nr:MULTISPECIES: endolytic peptidoglycan transglycosylase RlpA [Pectobacterium]MBQ4790321.1 endolytic peptidoglycan transglycosylase RlpA [Pectobacterium versatile]MCA6914208.1 endolytic peptidoglycan transglycosylase RlpA [Pectobacterium versatile]MCA6938113.1 endolytic peptidoglycan transglycosylase RlpA [Pectobacterium versatile]MCL6333222.1 endolytic peptidoglycan transglycosylase RlpA [Pectobacterium carotovorum subsp. carotovorum]MCL6345558.1 endolytic peptidoglycan transglycosylase RlpA
MRKDWLWVGVATLALAACTTTEQRQPAPPVTQVYSGPTEEIGGAEPRYEPYNQGTLQDYNIKGKTYKIVKNPQNFSETGLATWYGEEASGNRTSIGETFDPNAITAAHPTLPLPSYVRVTNLSNGRRLVVRVNDRGPYTPGRIIDLSKAAGDRLNISNNTKVKVDFISVASDGTLSGPGTVGTTVAKQSFSLPERPSFGASGLGTPMMETTSPTPNSAVRPISNSSLSTPTDSTQPQSSAPSHSGGFLGAPSALRTGVVESTVTPTAAATPSSSAVPMNVAPATAVAAGAAATPSASGRYVVQVGALSDQQRAQTWQRSLSERFRVAGNVTASGGLYRIQLGPFQNRQQAAELQQRLSVEAQQQSFITAAPGTL